MRESEANVTVRLRGWWWLNGGSSERQSYGGGGNGEKPKHAGDGDLLI
jgi:hypothetical protein